MLLLLRNITSWTVSRWWPARSQFHERSLVSSLLHSVFFYHSVHKNNTFFFIKLLKRMYSDGEKTVAKAMFVEMILIIPLFFELLLCRFFSYHQALFQFNPWAASQTSTCMYKMFFFFSNFKSIVRYMAYWSGSQIARLYRNIQLNEFAFRWISNDLIRRNSSENNWLLPCKQQQIAL